MYRFFVVFSVNSHFISYQREATDTRCAVRVAVVISHHSFVSTQRIYYLFNVSSLVVNGSEKNDVIKRLLESSTTTTTTTTFFSDSLWFFYVPSIEFLCSQSKMLYICVPFVETTWNIESLRYRMSRRHFVCCNAEKCKYARVLCLCIHVSFVCNLMQCNKIIYHFA